MTGYSETKKCSYCRETKNWRLFVMGTDRRDRKDECKACFHDRVVAPPKKESKPLDLEALFADVSQK